MKKVLMLSGFLLACPFIPLISYSQAPPPSKAADPSCGPVRDPRLRAMADARRAGHTDEVNRILREARQNTEQSAPDSPLMALYLRRTAGTNGSDPEADLRRALEIDTRAFGANSCAAVQDFYQLTGLGHESDPAASERLLKQVIDRLDDSSDHLGLKSSFFNGLANIYLNENRIGDATAAFEQATRDCDLSHYIPGPCDMPRGQLAELYRKQGRAADADRLRSYNPDERDAWQLDQLNRHGSNAFDNGQYPEAEETYRRGIQLIQQHPEHIYGLIGGQYGMLGGVLEKEGRDDEAEQAYLRGLELMENAAGPKPPQSNYAESLNGYGLMDLYRRKGRLQEMEPILLRILAVQEKYLPPDNRAIQRTLTSLADVYRSEKKYTDARSLYERLLTGDEKTRGADNPVMLGPLTNYAEILCDMHDDAALAAVQARINMLQLIQDRPAQQKPH